MAKCTCLLTHPVYLLSFQKHLKTNFGNIDFFGFSFPKNTHQAQKHPPKNATLRFDRAEHAVEPVAMGGHTASCRQSHQPFFRIPKTIRTAELSMVGDAGKRDVGIKPVLQLGTLGITQPRNAPAHGRALGKHPLALLQVCLAPNMRLRSI